MLTSLKLAALMAITTSLLVHPTSAAVYTFSCYEGDGTVDPPYYTTVVDGVDGSYTIVGSYGSETVEGVESQIDKYCGEGEEFTFDLGYACGCVATAAAAPPTDRPFVFLGKAEAAGVMESAYLAYTSALNRSLQHYIEDSARRLIEEARGSTERVCVVLVDLLRAGLNSELVDLEDFTDFYGKVIEELGCSDV
jgi:hypothetical protein